MLNNYVGHETIEEQGSVVFTVTRKTLHFILIEETTIQGMNKYSYTISNCKHRTTALYHFISYGIKTINLRESLEVLKC